MKKIFTLLLFINFQFIFSQVLDNTFGNNGLVIDDASSNMTYDIIQHVCILNDDKIIVCGTEQNKVALKKYNIDGSIDNSFGSVGLVTMDSSVSVGYSFAKFNNNVLLVAMSDGKIYSFNSNGTINTSFGNNGVIDLSVMLQSTFNFLFIDDLKITTDDKIILALDYTSGSSNSKSAVIKLNNNGTLDSTFGVNAISYVSINNFSIFPIIFFCRFFFRFTIWGWRRWNHIGNFRHRPSKICRRSRRRTGIPVVHFTGNSFTTQSQGSGQITH